jgi:nucleoid-associated protein YgaU
MAIKNAQIGKIKKSTDEMIADAIGNQQDWLNGKRSWARRVLRGAPPAVAFAHAENPRIEDYDVQEKKSRNILSYWFPILCAVIAVIALFWAFAPERKAKEPLGELPRITVQVPEPVEREVIKPKADSTKPKADDKKPETKTEVAVPSYDVIRIEKGGRIVLAGRYLPNTKISVMINKKAAEKLTANADGEFVYAPEKAFAAGNYTIQLVAADGKKSDAAFVYISPKGFENSVSLLMTKDGSKLMQAPALESGDLAVSKIDYLTNGRIVVQGNALPRLRVSLFLDKNLLGVARVSDHRNFGIGAKVGELKAGEKHVLAVKLHDGLGTAVAEIEHAFEMPEVTPGDETYYVVRRDDCLWIISRNFLGKGVLFTVIAEKNNIKNPDLIYPDQKLQIPVK